MNDDERMKRAEELSGVDIALPEVASQFIIAIDEGDPVEPFSFEVTT